jgi:hypothetical protein
VVPGGRFKETTSKCLNRFWPRLGFGRPEAVWACTSGHKPWVFTSFRAASSGMGGPADRRGGWVAHNPVHTYSGDQLLYFTSRSAAFHLRIWVFHRSKPFVQDFKTDPPKPYKIDPPNLGLGFRSCRCAVTRSRRCHPGESPEKTRVHNWVHDPYECPRHGKSRVGRIIIAPSVENSCRKRCRWLQQHCQNIVIARQRRSLGKTQ